MTSSQRHALQIKRQEYANARRHLGTVTRLCNIARTGGRAIPGHWRSLLGDALKQCAQAKRELKAMADDLYYELMGDRA